MCICLYDNRPQLRRNNGSPQFYCIQRITIRIMVQTGWRSRKTICRSIGRAVVRSSSAENNSKQVWVNKKLQFTKKFVSKALATKLTEKKYTHTYSHKKCQVGVREIVQENFVGRQNLYDYLAAIKFTQIVVFLLPPLLTLHCCYLL